MKTTRIFAAAIALLSVLSCQKEEQQTINNSENEGGAIITCTFASNDAATKTTTTDGMTPLWAAGDKIMLYDGSSNTQTLTLAASGTASSTEGIIDGTDATKFTFVKPSGWTNVYAIYPYSACVTGFSASAPKINFAGQNGTFAKANICAAAEVSGTMSFKNVGAILKFTSKSVKASKVVVPVAGLVNNFEVSFSGTAPSLASESASNSNEFSIGTGSGTIYIGIPAGDIAASSTFTYKSSTDAILGTYTTGAANTVEVNKIYNLGAMMGTLSGLFTIDGSGNKVQFSKGNLYYDNPSEGTKSFKFESNQYESQPSSAGSYVSMHVSHFRWANNSGDLSSDITSAISEEENLSGAAADVFFTNATATTPRSDFAVDGSAGIWRTLSSAEWTYLLNTRTDANRFAKAILYNIRGLIIFPDGYNGGETLTGIPGVAGVNQASVNFPSTSIAAATWSAMESAGCVFLPASGHRTGSKVENIGFGVYWSSTPSSDTEKAYDLFFRGSTVIPSSNDKRRRASSVRLVCSVSD